MKSMEISVEKALAMVGPALVTQARNGEAILLGTGAKLVHRDGRWYVNGYAHDGKDVADAASAGLTIDREEIVASMPRMQNGKWYVDVRAVVVAIDRSGGKWRNERSYTMRLYPE